MPKWIRGDGPGGGPGKKLTRIDGCEDGREKMSEIVSIPEKSIAKPVGNEKRK